MTTVYHADHVLSATGLLGDFNGAEVLAAGDVHTAILLGDLWQEADERVRLAAALTVKALRNGSVCIDITRLAEAAIDSLEEVPIDLPWPDPLEWIAAIRASPMVGSDDHYSGQPLRLNGDLLYLQRYWLKEESVRHHLELRRHQTPPIADVGVLRRTLDALFDNPALPVNMPDYQRLAAAMTALSQITVVAGGPGTGKTTTVAGILALHRGVRPDLPLIALAAPTGKAAARLEEAVRHATDALTPPWNAAPATPAVTLHKLLGLRPGGRPRHHGANPLPHDLIVVDEMSMVSLPLMDLLLQALRPEARLILVGDPDQLSSVEAGAVLADITRAAAVPPPDLLTGLADLAPAHRKAGEPTGAGVVTLHHTWRFGGAIGRLAGAIRTGDVEEALDVLRSGEEAVSLLEVDERIPAEVMTGIRGGVIRTGRRLHRAAADGDIEKALTALDEHRLLCAHRRGPFGVAVWERTVTDWLRETIPGYATEGELYPGLPLMVTANDPDAGLFNGDTGVVVHTPAGLRAAFARGGSPALFSTLQLNAVSGVHAMTVHKSQGSQFQKVTLILPPVSSPLLTRELLYTAVTRATTAVQVVGSTEALAKAIERPANRASGLGARLIAADQRSF